MPIKVYRMNYDGTNERIVAAGSQREAARLMGTTLHQFRNYGGVDDRESAAWAKDCPGEVWQRRMHYGPKSDQPSWENIAPLP